MNKYALFFLFFSCSCLGDQDASVQVEGCWVLSEVNGTGDVECPDVIVVQPNGRYMVFNDCRSPDQKYPLIEEGDWHIDKKNHEIFVLENRSFRAKYRFLEKGGDLTIPVVERSREKLVLKVNGGKELYRPWDRPVEYCQ